MELRFDVTAESLVLAYTLGVLLTLIVVTVSAWRVSMLIATAIRNLPEPPKQERRRRWLWPALGLVAGTLLAAAGVQSAQFVSFMLGICLVLLSLAPLARLLGVPERIAYTASGLAIVAFLLLPAAASTPSPSSPRDLATSSSEG